MASRSLFVGDPAPWFTCRSNNNPTFHFDTVGGKYIVLSFFGSVASADYAAILHFMTTELRHYFDDEKISFFGVSIDPADETEHRMAPQKPGIRFFWDFDRSVSALYGALDAERQNERGEMVYSAFTLVLDPFLRVIANIPMENPDHNAILANLLGSLPATGEHANVPLNAPVLILPRVFEPSLCREMIALYEQHGGCESGFMRERGEKTVPILDNNFKKRRDVNFENMPEQEQLRATIRSRIGRRLAPEIRKAFQFHVTHIERYIVACYDAQEGGFFRAHRDNTTRATAHRRFACTINLNAEDYEGGDLRFPEFGPRSYRAPTGGAVIFSCSLLHEATPVTKGTRYAFLPFLYDQPAAELRKQNQQFLSNEIVRLGASAEAPQESKDAG